jgi:hypothetical protein
MRLLNVHTKRLKEYFEKRTPNYATLSHTWGEDEVTFREFDPILGPRRTSAKIEGCCAQALEDGNNYVWIDTCCIDKSRSAELSEAIHSMFAWYKESDICSYISQTYSQRNWTQAMYIRNSVHLDGLPGVGLCRNFWHHIHWSFTMHCGIL